MFEDHELCHIDSSSQFESFIIVVEIILELGGQYQTGKKDFMDIVLADDEIWVGHVVPIEQYDGDDKGLGREMGVAVYSFDEICDGDGRGFL